MAIVIRRHTEEWTSQVADFNRRLARAGVSDELHFPLCPSPDWQPAPGRTITQESFLAVGDGVVRGGYILKSQDFTFSGETRRIVYYYHPISEGIADKKFTSIGVHMLREALKIQPLMFCLGMGGLELPLPRMLKAMRWGMCLVPFYFKVNHGSTFLRNIDVVRTSAMRRLALDVAASTGVGWLGAKALNWMRQRRKPEAGISCEWANSFGSWADELWEACKSEYLMSAVRDSGTLNQLYPGNRFLRLEVRRDDRVAGWAVMLDTQMHGHKQFGSMRLGSIVDCMASPSDAFAVVASATAALEERGVDLTISNQAHAAWGSALRDAGFLQGPSNFALACSPKLAEMIHPFESNHCLVHINRGDGDGPIHL